MHPDTDVTPYDMGTLGSRSTFHMGNAVRLAAEDARDKLAGAGARGRACRRAPTCRVAEMFQKKYGMQAGNIIGIGNLHRRITNRPIAQTGLTDERHAVLDGRRQPAPRSRSTPRPAHVQA